MSFEDPSAGSAFGAPSGDSTRADKLILFQSMDNGQILLPELGNVYALIAYFGEHQVEFSIDCRVNAENMSPDGVLPFVKCGTKIVSGYEKIVNFVNRQFEIKSTLSNSDIVARTNLFEKAVIKAELYYTWLEKETYERFTKPHYSFEKPWPLATILCWLKKRDIASKIFDASLNYDNEFELFFNEIYRSFPKSTTDKLTQQDALIYGHVKALNTYSEHYPKLYQIIKKFPNLFDFVEQVDTKTKRG